MFFGLACWTGASTVYGQMAATSTGSPTAIIETFGSLKPSETKKIPEYNAEGGFDQKGVTYSGTAEIAGSQKSTGYPNASGGANLKLKSTSPGHTDENNPRLVRLMITNLPQYSCTSVAFGVFRNDDINYTPGDLKLSYTTDGTTWVSKMVTTSTSWTYVTFDNLPANITGIRFTNYNTQNLSLIHI